MDHMAIKKQSEIITFRAQFTGKTKEDNVQAGCAGNAKGHYID